MLCPSRGLDGQQPWYSGCLVPQGLWFPSMELAIPNNPQPGRCRTCSPGGPGGPTSPLSPFGPEGPCTPGGRNPKAIRESPSHQCPQPWLLCAHGGPQPERLWVDGSGRAQSELELMRSHVVCEVEENKGVCLGEGKPLHYAPPDE